VRYFILIFAFILPSLSWAQHTEQSIRQADSLFVAGNISKSLLLLDQIEPKIKESINLAKCFDLYGEIYFSVSDVQTAKDNWDKALSMKQKIFGDNNIYLADSYAFMSKYYDYIMDYKTAYDNARKGLELCWANKKDWSKINVGKIYSTYSYALKLFKENPLIKTEARKYLDSALVIFKVQYPDNLYYQSQVYHSIGNTYTDDVLAYRRAGDKSGVEAAFRQAKTNYNKSVAIDKKLNNSVAIAMDYFTTELLYEYAYQSDSIVKELNNIQSALKTILPNYKNNNNIFESPQFDTTVYDKTFAVQLLFYREQLLKQLYIRTNNVVYAKSGLSTCEVSCKYWVAALFTYNSREISQLINIYNCLPFNDAVDYCYALYTNTKDYKYAQEAFDFSEKSKYAVILKQSLLSNKNTTLTSLPIINIPKLQRYLDIKKSTAIEYFTSNADRIYSFVITPDTFSFDTIPGVSWKLRDSIGNLRNAIAYNKSTYFIGASKFLYSKLIAPLNRQIDKTDNLILVPDGYLSLVPFEALVCDSIINPEYNTPHYLLYDHIVSYALSATLLTMSDNTTDDYGRNILGVSPAFKIKSPLPFSVKQMEWLSNQTDGKYFINNQTPENNFWELARNSEVVYIASHADSESIFLSDKDSINIKEVYKSKLNSSLVVLSACETSVGGVKLSDGVMNFVRAFSFAGAKSTISTLWKVDDQATSQIMKCFFENIISGMSKADAIHKAKLDFIKNAGTDAKSPFYWSGVILTGNTDQIKIKPVRLMLWIKVFAIISCISILIFIVKKQATPSK